MIKIPRIIHALILADLSRPHPFAGERAGFMLCRSSTGRHGPLFLCFDYKPVADDRYVHDDTVGARISGDAIREAMWLALANTCSVMHVHTHGCSRQPTPSWTDQEECPGIARSLNHAVPALHHGWVIIEEHHLFGEVLSPQGEISIIAELAVVGMPLCVPPKALPRRGMFRLKFRGKKRGRYDRQSFLGPDSERDIGNTRIGIIGLGGGGSHVIQQLAHLGFQQFVLCDPDTVEHSNLNRLVGSTVRDVNRSRSKVHVAARVVRGLHPSAEICMHKAEWHKHAEDIADCDIVVGCVDSFEQRNSIEAFCRRHYIPYIDIGMDVRKEADGSHEIYGQVVLSLPGCACLQCAQVVTDETLGKEVQKYGEAGAQPQVVWPNGVLASTAVGHCVSLVTGWSPKTQLPVRLDYRGSTGCLVENPFGACLRGVSCPHYPLDQAGDPRFRPL